MNTSRAKFITIFIVLICFVTSTIAKSNRIQSNSKLLQLIKSGIDGASMVLVPEGEFIRGSSDEQVDEIAGPKTGLRKLMQQQEQPQHVVYLDAFYIDQYEVTNARFQKFVEQTGYVTDAEKYGWGFYWEGYNEWFHIEGANWQAPMGPGSSIAGKSDHPVVQVSYNDALAYTKWAGKRLPTEAEWEKASRGTDGRIYPWGNRWNPNNLNGFDKGPHTTTPVGSYPGGVSPYGAYDMVGNVWEWVNDWYYHAYYQVSPYRNPKGPLTGTHRVLRGGCWLNVRYSTRCAHRDNHVSTPDFRIHLGGFRCAQDVSKVSVEKQQPNATTWGQIK